MCLLMFVLVLIPFLFLQNLTGLLIAWGLVDHRGIRALLRVSRAEFLVMALTCVATLLLEWQTAIYAGVQLVAQGTLPGLAELGINAEALEPVVASYLELQGRADPLLAMRQRYTRG